MFKLIGKTKITILSPKILLVWTYGHMLYDDTLKGWPEVIKTKFMLKSTEYEISAAHLHKYEQIKKFLALILSDIVFIMLIKC